MYYKQYHTFLCIIFNVLLVLELSRRTKLKLRAFCTNTVLKALTVSRPVFTPGTFAIDESLFIRRKVR